MDALSGPFVFRAGALAPALPGTLYFTAMQVERVRVLSIIFELGSEVIRTGAAPQLGPVQGSVVPQRGANVV